MASVTGAIDRVIDDLALMPVEGFYPTYVVKRTGLPFDSVFNYLLDLVKVGKLILKWEVHCVNYGCDTTIKELDSPPTCFGEIIDCNVCGEEIELTANNLFPKFILDKEYKADRKLYFQDMFKKKRKIPHSKCFCRFKSKKCTY